MKSSDKKKTEKKKDNSSKKPKATTDEASDNANGQSNDAQIESSSAPVTTRGGVPQQSFDMNDPWASWKSQQFNRSYALPTSSIAYQPITSEPFSYYDQTSRTPLPSSSIDLHRSLGHSIEPLSSSFDSNYLNIQSQVTSRLIPRRNELISLCTSLESTSQSLSSSREAIEKDTITDTDDVIGRLRAVEASKQTVILKAYKTAALELKQIDELMGRVNYYQNSNSNSNIQIDFLSRMDEFSNLIQKHATSTSTHFSPSISLELPHETADRHQVLSSCDHYHHLLTIRHHQLYHVSSQLKQAETELKEKSELCDELVKEAREWMMIADELRRVKHSSSSSSNNK